MLELSEVSRGHIRLVDTPVEGLNVRRFWKFEGLERNTIKADNFSGRLSSKDKAGS